MRAHFIRNKEKLIMYLPDSMRFFKINIETQNVVQAILDGAQFGLVSERFGVDLDTYNQLVSLLNDKVVVSPTPPDTMIKLTLNVSDTCNLGCKYCYAHEGKYLESHNPMSIETAKKSVDLFFGRFRIIQSLMFFGGEPTLNLPVVKFVCEYLTELKSKGVIEQLPILGMVTNGVVVSDEFIEMINKYNIELTVSLDGCAEVNDNMRVFKDGRGSSLEVIQNIKRLKENTNQPATIEATYNKCHLENNVSILNLTKYFKDELTINNVHIAAVRSVDGNTSYELPDMMPFENSIGEIFEEKRKTGKDYSFTALNIIIEGLSGKIVKTHYCEAGVARFGVTTNGNVFPCWIFADQKELFLGNVSDSNMFENKKFISSFNKFNEFNRFDIPKCSNCFYNTLCRKCIGDNFFETGELQNVPDKECEFAKRIAEQVICELCY